MKARDFKYLLAYIIPLGTLISLRSDGWLSYFTVILTFGFIPVLELMAPRFTTNFTDKEKEEREHLIYFDLLLFGNIIWVAGILFMYFQHVSENTWSLVEWTGKTMSVGIMLGSNGINVAHELGHKKGIWHQWAARLLLWPCLYSHFTTEHNYGHHLRVGTPDDPATSRLGENVFLFWPRTITGSFLSAWKIRLQRFTSRKDTLAWAYHPLVEFVGWPLLYLGLVSYFFGLTTLLSATAAACISIFLLETINYIEHYGLTRQRNENGRYEPVESFHSWNSNHEVGRVVLYELTRHSDHHYKAYKKYQILDHHDKSPQLPYGYPTSILLALIPPVWFRIMNPLVHQWRQTYISQ